MKKSLSHLPQRKRYELSLVRDIILEDFPDVQMIILFGSFARGDWVEDITTEGHITYEYMSDFDILVITESKEMAQKAFGLQDKVEHHIRNAPEIRTDASIIYHHIKHVNSLLSEGQYFFTDIKKEGILLYDSKKCKLARRRKLDPHERAEIAKEDFKQWFKSAKEFYDDFQSNLERRRYKKAAFELHQATERFYTAVLLVFTGYKPKTHNIETLGRKCGGCDPQFLPVFPRSDPDQDRMFKLLKKAYVDARYKSSYRITKKELEYLAARVRKLRNLTKKICKAKIESFV